MTFESRRKQRSRTITIEDGFAFDKGAVIEGEKVPVIHKDVVFKETDADKEKTGPVGDVALTTKQGKRPVINKLVAMEKYSTHKEAELPMIEKGPVIDEASLAESEKIPLIDKWEGILWDNTKRLTCQMRRKQYEMKMVMHLSFSAGSVQRGSETRWQGSLRNIK
jgi:hypothetical protein